MSNTARKARKRAGIPFTKAAKVGTLLTERAWYNALLRGAPGTANAGKLVPRSEKKRRKALMDRGGLAEGSQLFKEMAPYATKEEA